MKYSGTNPATSTRQIGDEVYILENDNPRIGIITEVEVQIPTSGSMIKLYKLDISNKQFTADELFDDGDALKADFEAKVDEV